METKKSEIANINKKKASFLMLGLVCATSLTLMSFELRSFDVSRDLYSDASNEDVEVPMVFEEIEIMKPQPKKVQVITHNNEIVKVTDDPIIKEILEPVDKKPVDNPIDWDELDDVDLGDDPGDENIDIKINEPFRVVEEMPEFPGGTKAMYEFLSNEVNYPEVSKEMGSEGIAYVEFVIEVDGTVSSVAVLKGVDKYIDKESKRVVENMPKWKAGMQRGKNVRVFFTLPIKYTMN